MIAHALFDSPWRLETMWSRSVFIFRQLTSNDYYFAISSIAERTFHSSLYARDPRQSCALDSTPWIPSSRYSVLDPGLQSLVGFRIPKPRISDSTSTNFHDSGIPKKKIYRIHVHFFFFSFFFFIYLFILTNNKLNTSKKWQKTEKKKITSIERRAAG